VVATASASVDCDHLVVRELSPVEEGERTVAELPRPSEAFGAFLPSFSQAYFLFWKRLLSFPDGVTP